MTTYSLHQIDAGPHRTATYATDVAFSFIKANRRTFPESNCRHHNMVLVYKGVDPLADQEPTMRRAVTKSECTKPTDPLHLCRSGRHMTTLS